MTEDELAGKTIKEAQVRSIDEEPEGQLVLYFTDGTKATVTAMAYDGAWIEVEIEDHDDRT